MEQQIRFCTAADGVSIAYAVVGEGPPFVVCPGVYSHLEEEWRLSWRRSWYEKLAEGCTLVRYDRRGIGLSQRGRFTYDRKVLVADLEAIVDHAGLENFALGGIVLGGASAILYAAQHPERVSRLVLYGTADRGTDLYSRRALAPLLSMARSNWTMASVLASNLATGAIHEKERHADEQYVRSAIDGETFARILELSYSLDLTDVVNKVRTPTLVIHQTGDRVIPIEYGRRLAEHLPNAQFLPLEGDSNVPFHGEAADRIIGAVHEFIGARVRRKAERLATALVTILFTDMEGSTPMTQNLGDAAAQELIRLHNGIVRESLQAYGGTQIKHTGDGIMASFPAATPAIECAVAIQRDVAGQTTEFERGFRVRIGLNTGEPLSEEGDLFGTAVQLAARVCAKAEPGQILASNVVRELAAGKGFLFSDRGEMLLRGFEDPVRLYEIRWTV